MLTLFTDTDTDVTPEIAARYEYKLISMPYSIDGKEVFPYEDFEKFDAHEFYQKLREGALPNTSAISTERYKQYFEPEFAAGNDIFYVHFSRAMTATFDAMDKAVAELKQKYPERKFYEVDTKGITILSCNIVMEIGEMFKKGASAEEVLDWAKSEVDHFAVYFFASDLKFFMHSGRVSGLAGTMGTLLGIRPIIHIGEDGKMTNVGKEKGKKKAVDRLATYAAELGDEIEKHHIVLASTDARELADEVGKAIEEKVGRKLTFDYVDVNPTAGSHCGPDTVGVSFHAIHR